MSGASRICAALLLALGVASCPALQPLPPEPATHPAAPQAEEAPVPALQGARGGGGS